jgi:hypothetical protein
MKEDESKILEKIRKLLNVANPENNGAEGEMQTAFSMAQKLLKKHHLDMSQVMDLDVENSSATGFFELKEIEVVRYVANTIPVWLGTIIRSVNIITETKTLIKRSPRDGSSYGNLSIIFVGESLDVSTASELFNFLKDAISKLSFKHVNSIEGKHKQWRSFADGCASKVLDRAKELEKKCEDKINKRTLNDLDISNREILDEDEEDMEVVEDEDDDGDDGDDDTNEVQYDNIDDEIDKESFSVELYNKYKDSKIDKIKEYLSNLNIESEKCSSRTAKIEVDSYGMGQKAGEKIPLTVSKKLKK